MAYGLTTAGGAVRLTGVAEHPLEDTLLWLDVGRPDHLGPLLGFFGNESARHRRRLAAWRPAKSADEPPRIIPARSTNCVFSLGSARPALISLLSLSTIPAGSPKPK